MTWSEFDARLEAFVAELRQDGYFRIVEVELTAGSQLAEPFRARLHLTAAPGVRYCLAVVEDPLEDELYFDPAQLPATAAAVWEQRFNLTPAALFYLLWRLELGRVLSLSRPPAEVGQRLKKDDPDEDEPEACVRCGAPLGPLGRCPACGFRALMAG
jgi:hypothetical protein